MRKVLKWLVSPNVAPLLARLVLVALTALAAEPEVAVSLGAAAEAAVGRLASKP